MLVIELLTSLIPALMSIRTDIIGDWLVFAMYIRRTRSGPKCGHGCARCPSGSCRPRPRPYCALRLVTPTVPHNLTTPQSGMSGCMPDDFVTITPCKIL